VTVLQYMIPLASDPFGRGMSSLWIIAQPIVTER
jgi:hypothetical protein